MSNFFVNLYNYFTRHKIILYLSLVASIAIMGYFALQLKFEENITQFFPDTKNEQNLNTVFDNLRIKDKIIVMFSSSNKEQDNDTAILAESATLFADSLLARTQGTYVNNILLRIDDSLKTEMQNFVYDNLPILLSDSDYQRIDSLFSKRESRIGYATELFQPVVSGRRLSQRIHYERPSQPWRKRTETPARLPTG